MMVKNKEMPYKERYAVILSYTKLEEFGKDFVEKHLDSKAAEDLQKEWGKGIKPISESASDKEKYETALSNWDWMGEHLLASFEVGWVKRDLISSYRLTLRL